MKTTRPPDGHTHAQMYFYAACRCSKTHSGFAHKAAGPLAGTGGAGTSGGRRTVEACFSDTERRLCPEKHKKHAHVCVCLSTNRHSHTHTSLMRAPYIIFVHNLICLSPAVYCAMVTGPTPGPPLPPAADTPSFDSLRGCSSSSRQAAALQPRTRRMKGGGGGGRRMKGRGGGGGEVQSDHTPRAQSATARCTHRTKSRSGANLCYSTRLPTLIISCSY